MFNLFLPIITHIICKSVISLGVFEQNRAVKPDNNKPEAPCDARPPPAGGAVEPRHRFSYTHERVCPAHSGSASQ